MAVFAGPRAQQGYAYGLLIGGTYGLDTGKYNYADDVISAGSNLSVNRAECGCVASPVLGFLVGGYTPDALTSDSYNFNTGVVNTVTNLSTGMRSVANHSSPVTGYMSGNALATNTTRKLLFATGATSAGTNTTANSLAAGTSTETTGYIGGGMGSGSNFATVNKYLYSNDSVTNSNPLTSARRSLASFGNTTKGYFVGGLTYNGDQWLTNVDQYTYANDTVLGLTALGTGRASRAGHNSKTAGYVSSGTLAPSGTLTATTVKLDFASNVQSAGSAITPNRQMMTAVSAISV